MAKQTTNKTKEPERLREAPSGATPAGGKRFGGSGYIPPAPPADTNKIYGVSPAMPGSPRYQVTVRQAGNVDPASGQWMTSSAYSLGGDYPTYQAAAEEACRLQLGMVRCPTCERLRYPDEIEGDHCLGCRSVV